MPLTSVYLIYIYTDVCDINVCDIGGTDVGSMSGISGSDGDTGVSAAASMRAVMFAPVALLAVEVRSFPPVALARPEVWLLSLCARVDGGA